MELASEVYRELEDIIGSEYITRDPAIRDTYNQVWGNKLMFDEKWSIRPAAVLLPATTEEIQAIVKVCNKFHVLFKSFSSGFEIVATSLESEKGIILDLRRMNRILEIDDKNMHALVEPYVSVYRLEIEAAKYGLYNSTIGAGTSAGVIASAVCHSGTGSSMISTGGLGRNILGIEWVLPTGEVLRLGTGGSGDEWFSADGPGPSLRGILRGHSGANGGHGVITKLSLKLYPWYGPSEWEMVREEGEEPSQRHLRKMPDGFKGFIVLFPNRDNMFEAYCEAGKAEILFAGHQLGSFHSLEGSGNDEAWQNYQNMTKLIGPELIKALNAASLGLIIGASSGREMAYREKCLKKICKKWGGNFMPELNTPQAVLGLLETMVWSHDLVRMTFRPTGDIFISPCNDATDDAIRKEIAAGDEMFESYLERKGAVQIGIQSWNPLYENYSVGSHLESIYLYNAWDPDSLKATREIVNQTIDPKGKFRKYGVPLLGGGLSIESRTHVHQNWGPEYDNYDVWLRKIRQMLDPNNVGDWSSYTPSVFP